MINVLITAMDAGNVPPGSRDTYLTLAAAHRVYYISVRGDGDCLRGCQLHQAQF